MDDLTLAWCYAHLWLHVFGRRRGYDKCPLCQSSTRPEKPRYAKRPSA